jgi:hypothetical protein
MVIDTGRTLPIFLVILTLVFPLFDSSLYFGVLVLASCLVSCWYLLISKWAFDANRKIIIASLFVLWVASTFGLYFVSVPAGLKLAANDLLEYIKLPYYLLLLIVFFKFFDRVEVNVNKVFTLVFYLISVLAIVSFFSAEVALLYTSPKMVHVGRLAAPFINPYTLAFVMAFYVLYFYSGIVIGRNSAQDRVMSSIYFLIAFILLLLTQSRSIAFGLIIIIAVTPLLLAMFFSKASRDIFGINILKVSLVVVVAVVGSYLSLEIMGLRYTAQLVNQIVNSGEIESGSVDVRLSQIYQVLDYFWDYPLGILFGFGPAKAEFRLLESGYAYILFRHGLIGGLIYSSLFVYMGRRSHWIFKNTGDPFFLGVFLFVLSCPLLLSSSMHIEHPKVSFIFILLIAVTTCRSSQPINHWYKI